MSGPVVIRAAHYGETEDRLMKDRVVQGIASELAGALDAGALKRSDITWPTEDGQVGTGTVRFEWTQRINAEYRKRGGTDGGHIGAVPTATMRFVDGLLEALGRARAERADRVL